MATMHRARVVAIGTQADMVRLCGVLVNNSDWMEEDERDEGRPRLNLEQLLEKIKARSELEGGPGCGFHYGMLAQRLYGQAHPDTCRFRVRQEESGLWTAIFAYDSDEPFQQEDWLKLHNSCGRIPMLALRASWDFALAKGMLIFTGGHILENWDRMDESWMYLIGEYECGYPPEEAVRRLIKLEDTLEREDSDVTISELLTGCMENLKDIADHVADPALLQEMMGRCLVQKDYEGFFMLQCHIAEAALWETEHNGRWLATLESVLEAWEASQT